MVVKALNHKIIEQQEFVEKYVLDQLTPEEAAAFEKHFFECDECFEKVKHTQKIVSGVKLLLKEDRIAQKVTPHPLSIKEKFEHILRHPAFSMAAVILVLILSYPAIKGIRLQKHLKHLQLPKVIGYSFTLKEPNTRSSENLFSSITPSKIKLQIPKHADFFTLSFPILESSAANATYQAQILNSQKEVLWEVKNLTQSNEFGLFSILCPLSFFSNGSYVLRVEELDAQGNPTDRVHIFPFEIVFK